MRSETKAFLGTLVAAAVIVSIMLVSRCDPWTAWQGRAPESTENKATAFVTPNELAGEKWYFSERDSPFDTVAFVNWDKVTGKFECTLPDGRKLVGKEDKTFLLIDGEVHFDGKVVGTFQLHQWPSRPIGTFLTGNIDRHAAELKRHDFRAKQ